MGQLAASSGVTVSVEPLQTSETNFVNRVSEALRIVRAVDQESVKITADIFHMLRVGEGPEAIREAGPWIHHVHIAEEAERTAPRPGGDDFRPYLRALRDIDYAGPISIECRWNDLASELAPAIAELRDQLRTL